MSINCTCCPTFYECQFNEIDEADERYMLDMEQPDDDLPEPTAEEMEEYEEKKRLKLQRQQEY